MAEFELTKLATNLLFPGNIVQLDDAGLPSIMVYIPKFKNSDVLEGGDDSTHPAFIVNGQEIEGFLYSKYQNVVHDGRGYSLPGEIPAVGYNFNAAGVCCEDKGAGWHLSTAAEWAAIALWCKKNGHLPKGNTTYGKDDVGAAAVPATYNENGSVEMVVAGTGPLTWAHDKTASGIWDMGGNVWERVGGIRLVWGEIQILANNDAAHPDNPQNTTSTLWRAINAADGSLVDPECAVNDTAVKASGATVKLDYVSEAWTISTGITSADSAGRSCKFDAVATTADISDAAKMRLRALALLPEEGGVYDSDVVYFTNGVPERAFVRGGRWTSGVGAGLFSLYASGGRDAQSTDTGFRATYIPEIATQTP